MLSDEIDQARRGEGDGGRRVKDAMVQLDLDIVRLSHQSWWTSAVAGRAAAESLASIGTDQIGEPLAGEGEIRFPISDDRAAHGREFSFRAEAALVIIEEITIDGLNGAYERRGQGSRSVVVEMTRHVLAQPVHGRRGLFTLDVDHDVQKAFARLTSWWVDRPGQAIRPPPLGVAELKHVGRH